MMAGKRYIVNKGRIVDVVYDTHDPYKMKAICRCNPNGNDAENVCNKLNELYEENTRLKQELQLIYKRATANKTINILEKYYDKLLTSGNTEIKDAERQTVLKCIEYLENFKDDLE